MKLINILKIFAFFLIIFLWPFSYLLNNGLEFKAPTTNIFQTERDEREFILQKGYLYPTVWMSRLFQNKTNVIVNKFEANFFALIDPNNYFFHFHPREILIDNQNLDKFPFLSIVFFIIGLYNIPKYKYLRYLSFLFLIEVFFLSFLKNFDKFDLILYPVLAIIIISGLLRFFKKLNFFRFGFLLIFIIFTLIQYLHILVRSLI